MQLKIKDNNKLIDCFYSDSIKGLIKNICQIDNVNKNSYTKSRKFIINLPILYTG